MILSAVYYKPDSTVTVTCSPSTFEYYMSVTGDSNIMFSEPIFDAIASTTYLYPSGNITSFFLYYDSSSVYLAESIFIFSP